MSWSRDDCVTVELVHDPTKGEVDLGTGRSHVVIKVESLDATITELAAQGIDADAPGSPDGADESRTTWSTDPDGNRIELVQGRADHPHGITAADWPDEVSTWEPSVRWQRTEPSRTQPVPSGLS